MEIAAVIFLFIAMLTGALLLPHVLQGKPLTQMLVKVHTLTFALALVSLILFAIITDKPEKQLDTIVVLLVTILVGGYLYMGHKRNGAIRKWLAIVYQALGMGGLIWLLIFVLN
ncbi:hypothetical protein MKJ04_00945 [Pontibacter sp. E15-1]|uniref:hypothetical protein n=1 Tax=Pontibacter sp. E15-1 TaxID=2919918 RepID=UPI001F501D61|nr:hypothetical protein [Pontibacter sp. E15-1]MCJ8163389.1 hypothetical protein [Pontibacter sp. E15-1]